MAIQAIMNAVNSTDALQQYIGINMLNKTKDLATSEASQLLKDFSSAQGQIQAAAHPHLGKHIDVRI